MKRASNPLSDLKHSWRNNWRSTTGTNKIGLILFVTLFFFGPLHYLRLCKLTKLMYREGVIRLDHRLTTAGEVRKVKTTAACLFLLCAKFKTKRYELNFILRTIKVKEICIIH